MYASCLNNRTLRRGAGNAQRACHRVVFAVRAQANRSETTVSFNIRRRVDFGQSLLLVGNVSELGAWDSKHAVQLDWSAGDNWSASLSLPAGSLLEYKYIIKRKDGLDWCPGQNKSVSLPPALALAVTDTWESQPSTVSVLTPISPESSTLTPSEETQAPIQAEPVTIGAPVASVDVNLDAVKLPATPQAQADGHSAGGYPAVSTVENIQFEELEVATATPTSFLSNAPSSETAPPAAAASQHGPSFVASNIVQGTPRGAVAVGASDLIAPYSYADKVVEAGAEKRNGATADVAAATAAKSKPAAARPLETLTMSELRNEAKRRGMSSLGNRRELITRMQKANVK